MPSVDFIQGLLEKGWGQVFIIAGLFHVVMTNKSMNQSFKMLVNKIKSLEDFVLKKEILDETRDKEIARLERRIAKVEERVRDLEKNPH